MQTTWQDSGSYGTGRITPVVKRLMVANAAIYLLMFALWAVTSADAYTGLIDTVHGLFAVAPHTWDWYLPRVWQVVTYGFFHSISPTHLLFNLLGMYFFGTMLESEVGGRRFLAFFLGAVIVGGLLALIWTAFDGSEAYTIGASGGVMAIVVAMARLRPKTQVIFFVFPMTLQTLALIFVGLDVFRMISDLKGAGGGVSFQAHLGGALFGFLAVHRRWLYMDPFEKLEELRAEREQKREVADEERLDEILAKIHREGIQSLTASEKAFLKRASRKSG